VKLVLPTLAVILSLAGCGSTGGGGASSEEEEETTPSSSAAASEGTSATTEETTTSNNNVTATVRLASMNGSGTTGTATFTDVAQGVVRVELSVLGLPDPNVTYLTHIHPGTCADEQSGEEGEQQGSDHDHEHSGHEAGTNEEIEYPLPPITADLQGRGSTSAVLDGVTVQELFSGEPKYINVHAEGSGNPPAFCGQLSMNIKSSAPSHHLHTSQTSSR